MEQKTRYEEWADEWERRALATGPADLDAAEVAARACYRACGLPEPGAVLRFGSPLGAVYGGRLAAMFSYYGGLDEEAQRVVNRLVDGAVTAPAEYAELVPTAQTTQVNSGWFSNNANLIHNNVWFDRGVSFVTSLSTHEYWWLESTQNNRWDDSDVYEALAAARDALTRASAADIRNEFLNKVRTSLSLQLGSRVHNPVGGVINRTIRRYLDGRADRAVHNAEHRGRSILCEVGGHVATNAYLRDICKWRSNTQLCPNLQEAVLLNSGWSWWHNDVCALSDRPRALRRDGEGRLHCEDGPAVAYPDGWSIYAWHGAVVPGGWLEEPEALTPEAALTWRNVEQRRAACEILGWNAILSTLNARSINKDRDPEIGELVEVELPNMGRERFLRVHCGTGRQFALPVPPDVETALQANAWTYGFGPKEFTKPEIRT